MKNKENILQERKRIGKLLQAYRKERGYTQEALAEVLGVASSTIAKIEGGAFSTGIDQINKVCEVLEIEICFKNKTTVS